MTALAWNEFYPAGEAHSFSQAELGPFTLYACDDAWRVLLANCEVAHGPSGTRLFARRAAEAWLRAHLHDLLRQLRDPINMGSDHDPPGGPLSEESERLLQQGFEDVKAGRVVEPQPKRPR